MPTTEERLRQLIAEHLEVDGQPVDRSLPLDSSLMDAGVSSMELAAFARVIQQEFSVKFAPENCAEIQSLAGLIQFLDANAA